MTGGADSDESPGEVPEVVRERIEADRYCATLGIEVVDLDPGRGGARRSATADRF
jgi:acyl-CoA thioesterase